MEYRRSDTTWVVTLDKSLEFAKLEGKPQLRHFTQPHTTGFNTSLERLRTGNPVIFDVTIYISESSNIPWSYVQLA
jgi:hypothetical protein